MTKEELKPEQIKNRLSDIGADIGRIALEYIAELEKENAELKEINTNTLSQLNLDNGELIIQLTKAEKLLNEFMRISKASDEDFEHDYSELIVEAEQFLKDSEVEK